MHKCITLKQVKTISMILLFSMSNFQNKGFPMDLIVEFFCIIYYFISCIILGRLYLIRLLDNS